MVAKHVNKKNAGNHVVWWLMHFYTHLLLLVQPSVQWLSIVNFNNDAKSPPRWILGEFDVSRIRPRPGGLPHFETFTWQNLTRAQGVTRSAGHPTYHVNVIKLKWQIIQTGGLPPLSELPHLPGVPHLHVKRPVDLLLFFTVLRRCFRRLALHDFIFCLNKL